MKTLTIAMLLFASSVSAGPYIELGIGKNGLFQDYWQGRESLGCMYGAGYIHRRGNHSIDFSYRHSSQCTRGEGFDERIETINDSIGVYYRYEWS